MIFDINSWLVSQVICKLFIYFAVASVSGGVLSLSLTPSAKNLRFSLKNYFLVAVIVGLIASILVFFLKVGHLAESGITGMFDNLYLTILWGSSVGTSTVWQVSGFGVLLIAVFCLFSNSPNYRLSNMLGVYFVWILMTLGVFMVIGSISIVGHSAGISVTAQIAIGMHVFAGLWWLGSLIPLQFCCSRLSALPLHQLMHRFGQVALVIIFMLIATGVWVALQLFTSFAELLGTDYGRSFLIKLSFVVALLSLGLWHKMRLVPRLLQAPKTTNSLLFSIRIETVIAMTVLVVTAILTTAVGPAYIP
jgi:putative copper resistance protein D